MNDYALRLTTIIVYIMGRRLPDEVVYRIRLRIDAGEEVAAIAEAVKVSKKTVCGTYTGEHFQEAGYIVDL
jgi:hypothetical protein